MNLPELITKLLLIERQLIEEGVDVNTVDAVVNSNCWGDSISISNINTTNETVELLVNLSGF